MCLNKDFDYIQKIEDSYKFIIATFQTINLLIVIVSLKIKATEIKFKLVFKHAAWLSKKENLFTKNFIKFRILFNYFNFQ